MLACASRSQIVFRFWPAAILWWTLPPAGWWHVDYQHTHTHISSSSEYISKCLHGVYMIYVRKTMWANVRDVPLRCVDGFDRVLCTLPRPNAVGDVVLKVWRRWHTHEESGEIATVDWLVGWLVGSHEMCAHILHN